MSFENIINQTDAIEAEKGINTFGFGFPILIRRDQADNKLTVAPIGNRGAVYSAFTD